MANYVVTVNEVFPITEVEKFQTRDIGIIGVSMGNPIYWRSSLENVLDWTASTFSRSILLVGDILYRWNEMITQSISLEEAHIKSEKLGDKLVQRLNEYLLRTSPEKFLVVRWGELLSKMEYKLAIEKFNSAYTTIEPFRLEINTQAEKFVHSLKLRGKVIVVSESDAKEYCKNYLIEELGVFSELMKKSSVLVYPGIALPLLRSIAQGDFSDLADTLQEGVYVQLKIRKT